MRQIKFRVWDNLKKEWLTNKQVFRINIGEDGTGNLIKTHEIYFKQHPQGHTIQQFTGLKDKNGREIYEGDIVLDNLYNNNQNQQKDKFIVCYYDGAFRFNVIWGGYGGACIASLTGYKSLEIIGNIFETPQLLNEQKN